MWQSTHLIRLSVTYFPTNSNTAFSKYSNICYDMPLRNVMTMHSTMEHWKLLKLHGKWGNVTGYILIVIGDRNDSTFFVYFLLVFIFLLLCFSVFYWFTIIAQASEVSLAYIISFMRIIIIIMWRYKQRPSDCLWDYNYYWPRMMGQTRLTGGLQNVKMS